MNRILFETDEIVDGVATFGGERAEHVMKVLHGEIGQVLKTGEVNGKIGTGVIQSIETSCCGDLSSEHRSIGASDHRRTLTIFISTAAVADWRPAKCAAKKLKKGEMSGVLKLVRNPDILKTIARQVGGRRSRWTVDGRCLLRLVGFAAETDHVLAEAARKCREKGLSFIVANDVTRKGCGFGTDTNKVTFVFPDGTQRNFPLMTKRMVAKRILEEIENED